MQGKFVIVLMIALKMLSANYRSNLTPTRIEILINMGRESIGLV